MQTSPSPSVNHNTIARAAVMNGVPIPPQTAAVLEARGIDVGELEYRLRQALDFRR